MLSKNKTVQVRSFQLKDCPELVVLMDQLGHAAALEELKQRFHALETSADDLLIVAEDSESKAVLGFLHAKVTHTMHYHPSIEICSLVVNSAARGQGVGKTLMSKAERWAQEKGLPIAWLRSSIKRDDAHKFYTSLGYDVIGTSHFFQKELD